MKKTFVQNRNMLEILIHLISWIIIFVFPLIFIERTGQQFNWLRYWHHSLVPISYVIVFYFNYFVLIPRFLFKEEPYRYIIYNLILLSVMGFLIPTLQDVFFPLPQSAIKHKPFEPRWVFVLRDVTVMAFAAGLSAIIRISSRWSKIEDARREAERQRTEAELKNLRNQLNPHFLLNTLNNIYALIAFNSDKAQQAVQELSRLLRHMLYDNQQMYVSLGKEVEFIRNYIELMRIRLSDNITLETKLSVDKDSPTPIAPLLFISLIENAFKHGISPTEPSYIYISLAEEEGCVICEIINTNFPKTNRDKSGSGIGLIQVSKRLNIMYPDKYEWHSGVSKKDKMYHSKLRIES